MIHTINLEQLALDANVDLSDLKNVIWADVNNKHLAYIRYNKGKGVLTEVQIRNLLMFLRPHQIDFTMLPLIQHDTYKRHRCAYSKEEMRTLFSIT